MPAVIWKYMKMKSWIGNVSDQTTANAATPKVAARSSVSLARSLSGRFRSGSTTSWTKMLPQEWTNVLSVDTAAPTIMATNSPISPAGRIAASTVGTVICPRTASSSISASSPCTVAWISPNPALCMITHAPIGRTSRTYWRTLNSQSPSIRLNFASSGVVAAAS